MSRPWRIEYEGALYHLLSRGNQRGDIFVNEKDRSSFLDTVSEMSGPFDVDNLLMCVWISIITFFSKPGRPILTSEDMRFETRVQRFKTVFPFNTHISNFNT